MSSDPDDRDPEEIRVEIAQTRAEMTGTIDAIQQRLAPQTLGAQAKEVARDATEQAKTAAQEVLQDAVREVKEAAKDVTEHAVHEVRDAARDVTAGAKDAAWDATVGRAEEAVSTVGETAKGVSATVIDTIKQNPIPAALAGLSLYWLYRNRTSDQWSSGSTMSGGYRTPGSNRSAQRAQAYPIRTGYASQAERDAMSAEGRGTTSRSGPSGGPADYSGEREDTMGGVGRRASEMASSASEMAGDLASTASEMAGDAADVASQFASSAGETAVDAGSSLMELIQRNPVPAALVGIGLGWLYFNRSNGHPDPNAHSGTHYRYGPQARSQTYRSGSEGAGTSDGVGSTVNRAVEQVGDLASSAQERVGEMADSTQEYVGDVAGTVVEQTRRAPGQLQRIIQDRPLTAAAVAASLGAAVGLWLPPSQIEQQVMGSAQDRVVDRVQEVASETIEKVQDVAQEVASTAGEQARAKGLTV